MTIALALIAAASYGLGDFSGGYVAQRVSAWAVALCAQVGGAVAILLIALLVGGRPDAADLGWAVVAGLGNGFGTAFLYRGLAAGRMGVVAPVSGVGAALIPVVVGVATGERPGPLVWIGVLAALPAIWLVSRTADSLAPGADGSAGVLDGVLAGVGFGTLFVALSRVGADAGLLPLALNQAVGGVAIVVIATLVRRPWLPREPRAALGLVSGLLGALATGLFMVASHGGHLTVAAVLVSLYPAFTVLLAAVVLHERINRAQGLGLALCAAAVALVAGG